jgi:hypothetical protein
MYNIEHYPDAKKHQFISFVKSGFRFVGYALLPFSLIWAASLLIAAEVLGVAEELV